MNRVKYSFLALLLFGVGLTAGPALADSSSLQRALGHLQSARNDLEQGGKGKGGHQKDALRLVGEAIEHVRKGIDQEQKKGQRSDEKDLKGQEQDKQQEQRDLERATKQEQADQEKALEQGQKKKTKN